MMSRLFVAGGLGVFLALGASAQEAQEPKGAISIEIPKRDRPVDFRADVLPFLKTNCIACHHAKDPEGQLVLETPKTILKGGESGPAAVPGKSAESLMLTAAAHQKKPFMPPRKNKVGAGALSPSQLGLLKLWIDQGAQESKLPEIEAPHWQAVTSAWHPIYAVGLDTEGQFAACGRAGHLFVYHVPTKQLIDQPSDPALASLAPAGMPGLADRDSILSLAFSPDGKVLATGGYRSIRIWKKELRETKGRVELPAGAKSITLSPDGTKAALVTATGQLRVFDLREGKVLWELKEAGSIPGPVRFSAGGLLLAGAAPTKGLRLWKSADGTAAGTLETPAAATALEWLAQDKQIAEAGADGTIRLWNVPEAGAAPEGAPKPAKELKAAAVELRNAAGNLLAASADGKLSLYNLETLKALREVPTGAPLTSLAVSPDGKRWLTVAGPIATLWNGDDGKKVAELRTDGEAVRRERAAQSMAAFAAGEVTYRQNAIKALEDLKKKEEAEVKVATDAVAPAEKAFHDKEEALAKARQDRAGIERGAAEAGLAIETAREQLEQALNALAITDPELALKQADADTAAVVQYLEGARKNPAMLVDARLLAEASGRILRLGRTTIACSSTQAQKAAADEQLAQAGAAGAAARTACEAATKAAAEAKGKTETGQKAVDEAKGKLSSVTAEADRKAAEEQLARLQGELDALSKAARACEAARSEKAALEAEAAKKITDRTAAAQQAAQAAAQARDALAQAKKALADAKTAAEAAIKAGEAQKAGSGPKLQAARKAEDAAAGALEIAKANFDSAKGRVEKAKESAVAADRSIQEATARLDAQKKDQTRLDAERKQATEAIAQARLPIRTGSFSTDGTLVLLGAEDGQIYLFGSERGSEAGKLSAHAKSVMGLSPAGTSVAVDGSVRSGALLPTWKLEHVMEPAEASKPPVDRVLALDFSPDGQVLASGGGIPSRDGELLLWNVAQGTLLREIAGAHSDTVFDVAFTPDGSLLASCAADKFARVFDAKTGKLVKSFEGHTNHVLGVSWNRTGRTLATSGADDVIKVWSLDSGQQVRTIPGFTKQATKLRYIGYDASFAVAAGGVPVRLVAESGNVTRNFESGGAFMYDLSLSGDGQTIAAGGLDGVLRLWSVADGKPLATFAPPGAAPPAK